MYTVLLIKPNDFSIDSIQLNSSTNLNNKFDICDYDNIKKLIENYTIEHFINESNDELNLKYNLVKLLNMSPDDYGDTLTCYIDNNNIYQLVFLDKQSGDINRLASILNIEKRVIYGNAILIKTNIPDYDTSIMNNVNIIKTDIWYLIIHNLLHYGLFIDISINDYSIDVSSNIKSIIFNNNCGILNDNNICLSDYEQTFTCIFKYNLICFHKNDKHQNINHIVSALFDKKIYGPCYVVSLSDPNIFDDIDINSFK